MEITDISVPLIDLEGLHGGRRSSIVNQIGQACKYYGFFLVKNHGIPETILDDMLKVSKDFFDLPEAERLKFRSQDPRKAFRLLTGSGSEAPMIPGWKDVLKFGSFPTPESMHLWPSNPPSFIKDTEAYSTRVRVLAQELLEAISESLNLGKDCIDKAMKEQWYAMAVNYYPPCPQPEQHLGSLSHTDPSVISLVLPADGVPGLQFAHNGNWLPVNPIPHTFVINVGDALQILSNGQYQSVCHRVKVSSEKERMSLATFCFPSLTAVIRPAHQKLVDDEHPPLSSNVIFGQFLSNIAAKGEAASCA